jgi:hypothetical protein
MAPRTSSFCSVGQYWRRLLPSFKCLWQRLGTDLILDVNDALGCRADPFRGHKPLDASFLGGFNPWDLRVQMLPGEAGDEHIDTLQLGH